MLIADLQIRILHGATGQLIRELTLDTTRDYQPRGLKPGPPTSKKQNSRTPTMRVRLSAMS